MIYQIIHVPNPLLGQISRRVAEAEFGEDLAQHMENMAQTMYAFGGVGLSGVQIGDLRRFFVCEAGESSAQKWIAIINPEIEILDPIPQTMAEGCLSVPMFSIDMERPSQILIKFQNPMGERQELVLGGMHAVICMHEHDHLDGIILLDRAGRMTRRSYLRKNKRFSYKKLGENFIAAGV